VLTALLTAVLGAILGVIAYFIDFQILYIILAVILGIIIGIVLAFIIKKLVAGKNGKFQNITRYSWYMEGVYSTVNTYFERHKSDIQSCVYIYDFVSKNMIIV
jgi:F0F1-type ATP synthase membrane subunit a